MEKHIEILSALTHATSDAREDTLKSIVFKTLEKAGKRITKAELFENVKKHFGFEPYKIELNTILEKSINSHEILFKDDLLELSDEMLRELKKNETILSDNEKKRFENFRVFIERELELTLKISDIKLLWKYFLNYLYNCFYEYGQEALNSLHPHINLEKSKGFESLATESINEFRRKRKDLTDIFEKIINEFPNYASNEDIDFIIELSQKTSSFSTLGVDPKLITDDFNQDLIDWTLYLDTNVLYSLLDLHSHPENQSVKSLIKLINDNKDLIKIKLRYSNYTYEELKNKRSDFNTLDDKMPANAIRAILKSDKVDEFAKEFYTKLLDNSNTIHPSKVIRFSQMELDSQSIKIGRNSKRVESLGESFIDAQMNDYLQFIDNRNTIREQFSKDKGINFNPTFRGDAQVRHDIILREIIRSSRRLKPEQNLTMNNVKFFGLTLDSMLISYDRFKVKSFYDEDSYPIFFKPSFLLDKLTRILPIKTDDYKVAFIKAITTKGFYRNASKSQDVLELVNYLKSKGIDNTDVIYNIISEDLFLEKLKSNESNEDFNKDEFITSELNRQFDETQEKLKKTDEELKQKQDENKNMLFENKRLLKSKEEIEVLADHYSQAIKTLQSKVSKLEEAPRFKQVSLDFESASENHKLRIITKDLLLKQKSNIEEEIEDFKDNEIKKWQRKIWWHLVWLLPLSIFTILLFTPYSIIKLSEDYEKISNMIAKIVGSIISFFGISMFYVRYFNETMKNRKRDNIRVPKKLKDDLESASRKLDEIK